MLVLSWHMRAYNQLTSFCLELRNYYYEFSYIASRNYFTCYEREGWKWRLCKFSAIFQSDLNSRPYWQKHWFSNLSLAKIPDVLSGSIFLKYELSFTLLWKNRPSFGQNWLFIWANHNRQKSLPCVSGSDKTQNHKTKLTWLQISLQAFQRALPETCLRNSLHCGFTSIVSEFDPNATSSY